jgi:deoxyribonuclease V
MLRVMDIRNLHPWNVTYKEAVKIQERLRDEVMVKKIYKEIKCIIGVDASYTKGSHTVWAGAVVLEFPSLVRLEERWSQSEVFFPYIPGLLSFREIPALLAVLRKISFEPDLIFCDGQGIAHPRGLGLASHLGVLLRKPTIGCAKSKLVGEFGPLRERKGDYVYLRYHGKIIGAVVRTRSKVKPIFVSPGYGVTLPDCIRLVLETCPKYRIPEPTRQADLLVNSVKGIHTKSSMKRYSHL